VHRINPKLFEARNLALSGGVAELKKKGENKEMQQRTRKQRLPHGHAKTCQQLEVTDWAAQL